MPRTWTIDELTEQAGLALSVDYQGPDNGQVRAVPDARTIRYYASLGLVDRPAAIRGRTALYERRHLEQVVAIKRLQAEGLSLAQVQERLAGASRKVVARVAALPPLASAATSTGAHPARTGATPTRSGRAFWKQTPAERASLPASSAGQDTATVGFVAPANAPPTQRSAAAGLALIAQLELAPGLTLSFEPGRRIEPDDLEHVRAAAEQLVQLMTNGGLLRTPSAANDS